MHIPVTVRARIRSVITTDAPRPDDRIGPGDEMFAANLEHYMGVGQSAMRGILAALQAAGRKHCDFILDLPSGHGRVLRWLRAKFPRARLLPSRPELRVIGYAEAIWDAHHDVVACMRPEPFVPEACPPLFRSEAQATLEPTRC